MQTYLAIVGSRHYPRPHLVQAYVAGVPSRFMVNSGGAQSVDKVAETAAEAAGLEAVIYHAAWKNLGRRAGPIRNERIIDQADKVVAFWDARMSG